MKDLSFAANAIVVIIFTLGAIASAWVIRLRKPACSVRTVHKDVPLLPLTLALWTIVMFVLFYVGITISPSTSRVPVRLMAYAMPLAWLALHGLFSICVYLRRYPLCT